MNNCLQLTNEMVMKLEPESSSFWYEHASVTPLLAERHVEIGARARAQLVVIVDRDSDLINFQRDYSLGEESSLEVYYLFLGVKPQHWQLAHTIGKRASITSHSLFIGQGASNLSVVADYNFIGQGSYGRVQVESMLFAESQLRYDANINVLPSAQQSDTRVDMRLRLDGPKTRGQIIPGLNIAANDVKAGHSASTFQLSKEDLFYLRSRGLSPVAVQRLLALALGRNFVRGLKNQDMADTILALIAKSL